MEANKGAVLLVGIFWGWFDGKQKGTPPFWGPLEQSPHAHTHIHMICLFTQMMGFGFPVPKRGYTLHVGSIELSFGAWSRPINSASASRTRGTEGPGMGWDSFTSFSMAAWMPTFCFTNGEIQRCFLCRNVAQASDFLDCFLVP